MRTVCCCVCERMHFRRVLDWAAENGVSDSSGVREGLGCGGQCGLCLPYIDEALRTGETEIPAFPHPAFVDEAMLA